VGDARIHTRSFGGGEVTPEFFGRIDDTKYQTGLALCRNFVVLPHGPVQNRAGTRFVREVKDSSKRTRTIPFVYSFDQSLLIELSVGAFRFHAYGQTIMDGPDPYELAHTYTEDELFELKYAQSGDVVTLTHRNHPPAELKRLGAINWTLTDIAFAPTLDLPTGLAGTPTAGGTPGTPFDTDYVITAITSTEDESLQSATVTVSNNLYDDGAYNTLDWDAQPAATRFNIYKKAAGLFGFIGQTDQITFKDDNIAPDLGKTPPLDIDILASADNYPGAVSYYEQRRGFAATDNEPQNVWLARAGTETNMNYSIPPQDNDSIQFKIAAREANSIRHLVPMSDLIALTPAAVWKISGGASEVLTPLTLSVRQQSFVGASDVKPALVGNNMLYVAARGGHIRELGFDGDRNGYVTGDVSIRAPHLFDGYDVTTMTVSVAPYPIIWNVSTSRLLIGFTYIPEQQVGAFHWHDTGPDGRDAFEDATTLNENGRDVTYVVVNRTIDGSTVRYIEFFADRLFLNAVDQHFVDCGGVYDGAAVNQVDDIDWLEGETISILADGAVCPQQVVIGGSFNLPEGVTAEVIHFGLPYVSDMQTLPMALELAGYGQGMPKNVSTVWLRVYRSSGIFAGPSFDELREFKQRAIESMGSPPDLKSEEIEIVVDGAWTDDGSICVRQSDPLGLTVLAFTADFALGGG
jgi:hypothetical protein